MARITESELTYWLSQQDKEACLLVVEGNTDLRFWSLLVPISQRSRTEVYSIDSIDVSNTPNSNRGRAIELARRVWETDIKCRVKFFLDADSNNLLSHNFPGNVILTDFRDLECYVYHVEAFRSLLFSFGSDPESAQSMMIEIEGVLRTCGLLRLLDAVEELLLPFQKTWGNRLHRYISGPRSSPQVNASGLITPLFQNAGISLARIAWAKKRFAEVECDWADTETAILAHGKDLVSIIAWRFKVTYDEAERSILAVLAESCDRIRVLPQLHEAEEFVRLK